MSNLKVALCSLLVSADSGGPGLQNALDYARESLKDECCSQCGCMYGDKACGPTHAIIKAAIYHSSAEAKKAFELDLLKKAGKIEAWWPQVRLPLIVTNQATGINTKVCDMIVDFEVLENDGHRYYIEVKEFETEVFILKRKLMMALYPDLDYRIENVLR